MNAADRAAERDRQPAVIQALTRFRATEDELVAARLALKAARDAATAECSERRRQADLVDEAALDKAAAEASGRYGKRWLASGGWLLILGDVTYTRTDRINEAVQAAHAAVEASPEYIALSTVVNAKLEQEYWRTQGVRPSVSADVYGSTEARAQRAAMYAELDAEKAALSAMQEAAGRAAAEKVEADYDELSELNKVRHLLPSVWRELNARDALILEASYGIGRRQMEPAEIASTLPGLNAPRATFSAARARALCWRAVHRLREALSDAAAQTAEAQSAKRAKQVKKA